MSQLGRSAAREKIMVILYQTFLYINNKSEYVLEDVIKENVEIEDNFVNDTVKGVLEHINDIDKIANKHLENWTIDRLAITDQAILRMGIFEIMYTETPEIVCINEAIELSKQYSDEKISNMINGVLDKIFHGKE